MSCCPECKEKDITIARLRRKCDELGLGENVSLRAQLAESVHALSVMTRERNTLSDQLSSAESAIRRVRESEHCKTRSLDNDLPSICLFNEKDSVYMSEHGISDWAIGTVDGHRCAASCTDKYWEKYHSKKEE
jgi:hypothetical protein